MGTLEVPSCSKNQQDALFLNFILERTVHDLDRLTVHHQEYEYCINSNWYLSYSYVDCLLARSCRILSKIKLRNSASFWLLL